MLACGRQIADWPWSGQVMHAVAGRLERVVSWVALREVLIATRLLKRKFAFFAVRVGKSDDPLPRPFKRPRQPNVFSG